QLRLTQETHPQSIGLLFGPILIPTRDHVTEAVNGFPPQRITLKIVLGASKQETNGFQPSLNADKA
ncbi:hypothetical protein JMJ77_0008791, partial [Colletotrichum scovillei]